MASQGKTLGDLYHYAESAQLKMVCDLIEEGLAGKYGHAPWYVIYLFISSRYYTYWQYSQADSSKQC